MILNKIAVFSYILLGIVLGFILTFYTAGLFVLSLFLASLLAIKLFFKKESSSFLIKLFIISFILRAAMCLVNYNVGLEPPFWGGDTQPDAAVYNVNAFYISHLLKDNSAEENLARARDPFLDRMLDKTRYFHDNRLPDLGGYQFDSNVFGLGVFYAWLGYAPVAAKMTNSLICCLSIILVYLISRRLFGEEKPSRIAAVIFAFFPSIFYWSVTGLRDSVSNFLLLAYLLFLVKLITEKKFKYIFWALLFIYLSNLFRTKLSISLLAGLGVVSVFALLKALKVGKSTILRVSLIFAVYFILAFVFADRTTITSKIVNTANFIARINLAQVVSGGAYHPSQTNYRIYSDLVYQQGKLSPGDVFSFGYLATILKAILYFFFAPFPFGNWSLSFLPFYPQVIYWYLMAPFTVTGWLLFLKKDKYTSLTLTALLLVLILPAALFESNIGTAFRHKDMFIPVAFIFAAYALTRQRADNRGS